MKNIQVELRKPETKFDIYSNDNCIMGIGVKLLTGKTYSEYIKTGGNSIISAFLLFVKVEEILLCLQLFELKNWNPKYRFQYYCAGKNQARRKEVVINYINYFINIRPYV